ncbi:MAG: class A beta-lactamase-related serine hydrolase [Spirochaetia bacterium]|nr:class A beta-lactamase-related serine hydrolase [Spirochaetia bacterium]
MFSNNKIYLFILILFSIFNSIQCNIYNYYEIRSKFLPAVNYSGGLCRVNDDTQMKLLSRNLSKGDPAFAKKISNILSRYAAYFAVSIYDEESGYTLNLNSNLIFHAASTYKAAILIALMRMDQQNKLALKDKILVENTFESIIDRSPYSLEDDLSEPDTVFSNIGEHVSIKDLLNIMIEKSSNLATNVLVKNIGAQLINDTLNELGSKIIVARGVSDHKAYADCINNVVNASELESLYKIIYNENKIDLVHRKIILDILEKNSETSRLPGKLPDDVKVAHKPGNTSQVFHDAGIIIPQTGSPYFITILTSKYKSRKKITQAIADVSLLVYQEVLKARHTAKTNNQ